MSAGRPPTLINEHELLQLNLINTGQFFDQDEELPFIIDLSLLPFTLTNKKQFFDQKSEFPFLIDQLPLITEPLKNKGQFYDQTTAFPFYDLTLAPCFSRPYPCGIYVVTDDTPFLELHPLGNGICYNCENLSSITLPSSLQEVTSDSFLGTQLSEVSLPEDCSYSKKAFNKETTVRGGIREKYN